jgi:Flp pilus assembly protein TadD
VHDAYRDSAAALDDNTRHLLRRADGFLDLQMLARARQELEKVDPALRTNPVCERVALRLAYLEEDWPSAATLAERHVGLAPDDWGLWVQWAYAARRAAGIANARAILLKAWDQFPDVAVIPYNLACYACRDDDLAKARDLLARAFALDETYRQMALEDEDLEPLWAELGG